MHWETFGQIRLRLDSISYSGWNLRWRCALCKSAFQDFGRFQLRIETDGFHPEEARWIFAKVITISLIIIIIIIIIILITMIILMSSAWKSSQSPPRARLSLCFSNSVQKTTSPCLAFYIHTSHVDIIIIVIVIFFVVEVFVVIFSPRENPYHALYQLFMMIKCNV